MKRGITTRSTEWYYFYALLHKTLISVARIRLPSPFLFSLIVRRKSSPSAIQTRGIYWVCLSEMANRSPASQQMTQEIGWSLDAIRLYLSFHISLMTKLSQADKYSIFGLSSPCRKLNYEWRNFQALFDYSSSSIGSETWANNRTPPITGMVS